MTEKTNERCDCFETTRTKAEKVILDKIGEHVDFKMEWDGYSYLIGVDDYVPVNPKITYAYRRIRKCGTPAQKLTRDTISIMARYCPFCGRDTKNG